MKIKRILAGFTASVVAAVTSGIFTVSVGAAGDVMINETNFPDAKFRAYVSTNFDNGDGKLSQAECEAVGEINVTGTYETRADGIKTLKGIEYFPNLDTLRCGDNAISKLDVSRNTKITFLECYRNELTKLDLRNNTALSHLDCDYNKLSKLDVSANTRLGTFNCLGNDMTELILGEKPRLAWLKCGGNKLTSLDVSKLSNLSCLYIQFNLLTELDLSQNTKLEALWCQNNRFACLDISKTKVVVGTSNSRGYLGENNVYPIDQDLTSLDLSTIKGFDTAKASNWEGAVFDEATKTISDFTSKKITYDYDIGRDITTTFAFELTDMSEPEPDPEPDGDVDAIWVNGKDIKDNKKTSEDETAFYKTKQFQCAGLYSGGKWIVAVTTSDINTVESFLTLFDEKGKLNSGGKTVTGSAKKIASAKLKDGTVTVSAGKEAGTVNVWVYELKKDAAKKKNVIVNSNGIAPSMKTVTVLMAPGAPVLAESLSAGIASSGVSKLTLAPDESKTLLLGDKKAAFDKAAKFTLENSDKNIAEASLSKGELTVKALKAGKTKITITCVQSGKKVSLTVECKAASS